MLYNISKLPYNGLHTDNGNNVKTIDGAVVFGVFQFFLHREVFLPARSPYRDFPVSFSVPPKVSSDPKKSLHLLSNVRANHQSGAAVSLSLLFTMPSLLTKQQFQDII